ncbi:MAG: DUF2206 domain-containing protein [Pyrobaculum sp.]
MSFYHFYAWAGHTTKIVVAGILLVLFLLLFVNNKIKEFPRRILTTVFLLSLPISYYGYTYIFIFYLVITSIVLPILAKIKRVQYNVITPTITIAFIIVAVSWYLYVANGSIFNSVIKLPAALLYNVISGRFLLRDTYAGEILFGKQPVGLEAVKIMTAVLVFFVFLGLIYVVVKHRARFGVEFSMFAILSIPVGGSVFLGGLSSVATPDRIFHLISIFLAPVYTLGLVMAIKWALSLFRKRRDVHEKAAIITLALFTAVYLLFNSGFISEIMGEFPGAPIYISAPRIEATGTVTEKAYLYQRYVPLCDIAGGMWLLKYGNNTTYADNWGVAILRFPIYGVEIVNVKQLRDVPRDGYIYLWKLNKQDGIIVIRRFPFRYLNFTQLLPVLEQRNKIYTNGCSDVYG